MATTGRPQKNNDQVKGIIKHIRYSSKEWENVQQKLVESGLSFSDFVRKATFQVTIKPIDYQAIDELHLTRNELVRIGRNINAIAKHGAMITDQKSVEFFLRDLQKCKQIAMELSTELDKITETIR